MLERKISKLGASTETETLKASSGRGMGRRYTLPELTGGLQRHPSVRFFFWQKYIRLCNFAVLHPFPRSGQFSWVELCPLKALRLGFCLFLAIFG